MPFDDPRPDGIDRLCKTLAAAIAIAILLVLVCCALAHGAPPPDADGRLHQWFETQHSVAGAWCCNVADGFILADKDWRHAGDRYEVRIDGLWHQVPPNTLRAPQGGPNPTGAAIVWYRGGGYELRIFCFAPGFEY